MRWNVYMRWVLVAALAIGLGCVHVAPPVPTHRADGTDAPRVVILTTSDNPLFAPAVNSFIENMAGRANLYQLSLTSKTAIEQMRMAAPDLIVALGTRAALEATKAMPKVPTLFVMVVNYRRTELATAKVMGVGLETPVLADFTHFKMVLPDMKKALVFYAPEQSQSLLDEAQTQLQPMGVELVGVPFESVAKAREVYATKRGSFDAVWLMNDPVVMTQETFEVLRELTVSDKIPLFASLSERFAQMGALMSVSVDFKALGAQAAIMARSHLEQGRSVEEIGIQPPIGSHFVVNLTTAEEIGVTVPDEIMPFINQLIVEFE